jgi:molybdopterin molybdotransferase
MDCRLLQDVPGCQMVRYKPDFDLAVEIMRKRLQMPLQSETCSLGDAAGRVVAVDVVAGEHYPAMRLAGMDGYAVGENGDIEPVLTATPVANNVQRIMMEEHYDPVTAQVVGVPTPGMHVWEPGTEYRPGEKIVEKGQRLDAAGLSQLAFARETKVHVYREPLVKIILFGDQDRGLAVRTWLHNCLRSAWPVRVETSTISSVSELPDEIAGADLGMLVSDGAPGRYGRLRRMNQVMPKADAGPDDVKLDFWKAGVYPCKHMGFGRVGRFPMLVLPDLMYKSVMATAALLPYVISIWFDRPVLKVQARLTEVPVIRGPFPYVLPVRLAVTATGWQALPLAINHPVSGRGAVELDGLAWFEDPPESDGVSVLLSGWRATTD